MKKKNILIVEDDSLSAGPVEKILLSLGYSVTTVINTGKAVVSKIIGKKPDLILMDVFYKAKADGIDIARKVRKLKDIPIVYLTAHSEDSIVKRAKLTEPYGYLLKPVAEKELEIAIELALNRHRIEKKYKNRMERKLEASEKNYRKLAEDVEECIVMQNPEGIITYANQRFLDMIGYTEEEILGKPLSRFLASGLLQKPDPKYASAEEDVMNLSEISWRRRNGELVFTIFSPKPVYNERGEHKGTTAILIDITDRREVEQELHRSKELLRRLSQHIQDVRERESKRIAREIHDEMGLLLTLLKMDLSWIANRINPKDEGAAAILSKIDTMSELVTKSIKTVQKISAELRPGLLDDLGLGPAIEWLAQEFENQMKIPCSVRIQCDLENLDPDCSTAIFRISQESLTNVVRHAEATKVSISLKVHDGSLVLRVQDNGKGIAADDIFAPSSLGLIGMRERARVFGGELGISGKPNKGTALTVAFPVERIFKT